MVIYDFKKKEIASVINVKYRIKDIKIDKEGIYVLQESNKLNKESFSLVIFDLITLKLMYVVKNISAEQIYSCRMTLIPYSVFADIVKDHIVFHKCKTL